MGGEERRWDRQRTVVYADGEGGHVAKQGDEDETVAGCCYGGSGAASSRRLQPWDLDI